MGLSESGVVKKSTALVGFSGEAKNTIREISFRIYTEGINLQVKFLFIVCVSAYNIILGRTWVHKMKVIIMSSYQQIIKFPTS